MSSQTSPHSESAILYQVGKEVSQLLILTVIPTFFYGSFVVLFVHSTRVLLKKDTSTRNTRLWIFTYILMFIIASISECFCFATTASVVDLLFSQYQDMGLAEKLRLIAQDTKII
ncbi:hypothetical protein BDZ94DRAFT_1312700 [Collybia nuda]|uniref:Uncharacterized protein n=1 Tax=Collybia nuda TaxID=64659 RepID=A0A9P5XYF8_9AGAR|nr:hypothetical protein BDZ94DRAFT_1312700 [Collybia nuda]